MDNRFTVKDFFLFTLVVVAIAMIGLSMRQFDRQWDTVKNLEIQNRQITSDVNNLRSFVQDLAAKPPPTVTVNNVVPGGISGGATMIPASQPTITIDTGNATADRGFAAPFKTLLAARAKPDFAEGDWLVDAFPIAMKRITQFIDEDVYGQAIRSRVMDTLLTRDPNTLKFSPLLAESFQLSPDGLELRYKLRRGITFSDGTPCTADDVIFTFDWIMNPVVAAARQRSYFVEQELSWEKVNDYEVIFRMKKPYFSFLSITGEYVGIMSKQFISQFSPSEYNDHPGILLGTGPYRMRDPKGWRPGVRLELLRNERYWGPKPGPDRLVYLEVEEEAPGTTMYQNGEIDSISSCSPEQFDQIKNDPRSGPKTNAIAYNSMLGGYTYVGWNQDRSGARTVFADKKVRQALTMMVDRERMAKELWRGYALVSTGPFSTNGRQAAPDVKPWPFDPERAKKQLEELGFADKNGDGVLETPEGKPFTFELTYPSKSELSQRIALFLKDSYARGGVLMEFKPADWPTLLERLNKRDFDAITLGWSAEVESDLYQIFHSSQRKDGGDNRTGYANPELDKTIEAARSEMDEEKRMLLWQQCTRIIHEDQPCTFLLDRQKLTVIDKRVQNVEKTRMGLNFMPTEFEPLPWYVPKGMQKHAAQ